MTSGKMTSVTNKVELWLWLIGTKENASRLRARITSLKRPPLDQSFGPEPLQCPLTVMYGAEVSRQAYANPMIRPALDAWDTGEVTPDDLRRWCLTIEKGDYAKDWRFDPVLNGNVVKAKQRAMAGVLANRIASRGSNGNRNDRAVDGRGRKAQRS